MRSDLIKKGFERAPHRSLLRACGVKNDDFDKPFIGVCNSFVEIIPGHVHLQKFGRLVKTEIQRRHQVLVEANRDVQVLEKLRSRQSDQHRYQENRREIAHLDEIGQRRTVREDVP